MNKSASDTKSKVPAKGAGAAEGKAKAAAGKVKKKKHFKVTVYRAWCKRCGICVAFCPVKALYQEKGTANVIPENEKCIGCRRCERHCPDFSIVIGEVEVKEADQGDGGEAAS